MVKFLICQSHNVTLVSIRGISSQQKFSTEHVVSTSVGTVIDSDELFFSFNTHCPVSYAFSNQIINICSKTNLHKSMVIAVSNSDNEPTGMLGRHV